MKTFMVRRFKVLWIDKHEGADSCASRISRWDFHWQRFYWYQDPLMLNDTTPFSVTCTFDTRDRTEPVLPGWGTNNEMCLEVMYLVSAQTP